MMGAKGGVQAKLQEYAPFARFVHCVCHRQALLGAAAVNGSAQVAYVHSALQKIYVLFARSGIRLEKLHDVSKHADRYQFSMCLSRACLGKLNVFRPEICPYIMLLSRACLGKLTVFPVVPGTRKL
jgi:hypothetical protein